MKGVLGTDQGERCIEGHNSEGKDYVDYLYGGDLRDMELSQAEVLGARSVLSCGWTRHLEDKAERQMQVD